MASPLEPLPAPPNRRRQGRAGWAAVRRHCRPCARAAAACRRWSAWPASRPSACRLRRPAPARDGFAGRPVARSAVRRQERCRTGVRRRSAESRPGSGSGTAAHERATPLAGPARAGRTTSGDTGCGGVPTRPRNLDKEPMSDGGWSRWQCGRGSAGLGRPSGRPGSKAAGAWTRKAFRKGRSPPMCSFKPVTTAREVRENPKFIVTATWVSVCRASASGMASSSSGSPWLVRSILACSVWRRDAAPSARCCSVLARPSHRRWMWNTSPWHGVSPQAAFCPVRKPCPASAIV